MTYKEIRYRRIIKDFIKALEKFSKNKHFENYNDKDFILDTLVRFGSAYDKEENPWISNHENFGWFERWSDFIADFLKNR